MTSDRSNAQLFMWRGHNQNVCHLQEFAGVVQKDFMVDFSEFLIGQKFKTIFKNPFNNLNGAQSVQRSSLIFFVTNGDSW